MTVTISRQPPNFAAVDDILRTAIETVTPAAQLVVRWRGDVVFAEAYGYLDPETRTRPTQPDTRFDMASVTKLFAVTAFMTLVEEGRVALDQPVRTILPDFDGLRPIRPYEDPLAPGGLVTVSEATEQVNAGAVTFRHLLSHTSGLPAWRPLHQEADAEAARQLALSTFFSYPTGARVVYSDIGLILLGMAIEALTGHPLDAVIRDRVTAPLGLTHTGYSPVSHQPSAISGQPSAVSDQPPEAAFHPSAFILPPSNIAPTEFCAWRGRRIVGEVHDENAWRLGGVSGHAGIFSTASEIAAFGQLYLEGGAPLLHSATVAEMTRLQAETGAVRRGLGFVLWSPDPEASSHPFGPRTFGHTGFTGTSLWMDPDRALVVALLTNDVYHGRQGRGIAPLRVAVHQSIVTAIDHP